MKTGKIVAVCTSPSEGVPKYPQDQVVVADHGFQGDYHCKPMRRSASNPGTEKPNTDRHITIVAKEAVDAVNQKLGLQLGIGALGENILTEGLGDLSEIIPYTEIVIRSAVMLVVVGQNQPCENLVPYHPQFVREIHGRRGLLCAVTNGIDVVIKPDDNIMLMSPSCDQCGNTMTQGRTCWKCENCGNTLGCE